ncbi:MAG: hypothetical protein ACR2HJ_03445 [Fimbriimonadales bacterium]
MAKRIDPNDELERVELDMTNPAQHRAREPGKLGRPSKLTAAVTKDISQAIMVGASRDLAAQYGGINRATFYEWLRLGREAEERDEENLYLDFLLAVEFAEAAQVVNDLTLISLASETDWRAAAWRLERRFPNEYGKSRAALPSDGKTVEGGFAARIDKTEQEIDELLRKHKLN